MSNQLQNRQRIQSIDVLRGIAMVIMALDHTRDFFHINAITDQPTNMATTSPILFFTRWITHFCAPTFVFLSGMSAFLNGQKKTRTQLSSFLLKRGAWLIIVEIAIMSLALTFNPFYNFIFLQVIWAIGISMILLAALIHLPFRVLFGIGLLIFFAHNLLDYPESAKMGNINLLWGIIHGRNAMIPLDTSHVIFVTYSFLPWSGLMILGYCCGKLFTPQTDPLFRRKILLRTGFSLVLLFTALRLINMYGDPFPWATQKNSIFTFLSFMNVNKYPPSLIFCCMTIGPALIILALIENLQNKLTRFFSVYGGVPLFYFILHFFLIHFICVILFFASGYKIKDAFSADVPFGFRPLHFGYPLWVVYLLWVFVVLSLYPICKKYKIYKSTHRQWWLTYL
ncbi:MAG: heparan-alpha-glucosaminide N-acetyltransferase domain-containing protein [Chitinophagaceae bacterium]